MRKVRCPTCEHTKRPYGIPRGDKQRPTQPTQRDYKIGTYEYKCDKCGTVIFIRMDYVLEMAPVDIKEAWTPDGVVAEVVDEKRSVKVKEKAPLKEVDEDEIRPPKG
jgi:hypothetical protein